MTIISTILTIIGFSQNAVYKFSSLIEKEADTTFGHQMIANDYCKIGQYRKALNSWDKDFSSAYKLSEQDSLNFLKYSPYNAIEYILSVADNYQVIMINEAHHSNLHRNFTKLLLKGLAEKGFKYFGLEAVNQEDNINERKYPLQSSGYYTKEPEFGNLLREALNLDYFVFGYEASSNSIKNPKQREIEQAENIKKILDKDPKAKIIIHAGFDHIREDENFSNWEKAMAGRFKEITGINPLTIDQVTMSERGDEQFENPCYKLANVKESTIFINKGHRVFVDKNINKQFDIQVFHPKTVEINNRYNWLYYNKEFFPIKTENILTYPCFVFAFKKNEYNTDSLEKLIPVDILEFEINTKVETGLVLEKGTYVLIFKDSAGNKFETEIEIK